MAELGERLATRSLGLVRIADAATFSWPGPWIAIGRDDVSLRAR